MFDLGQSCRREPNGALTYAPSGDLDGRLDPGATHVDTSIRSPLDISEPLV